MSEIEELGTFSDVLSYLERHGVAQKDAGKIVTLVFMWGIHAAMERYTRRIIVPADVPPSTELFALMDSGPPAPVKVRQPKVETRRISWPWPENFKPTLELTTYAAERGFTTPETGELWEKFRNRNLAKGERYAGLRGWEAAWRNWVTSPYNSNKRHNVEYVDPRI